VFAVKERAFALCRLLGALAPDHPVAHNNLAGLLLQQGKAQESLAHSLAALQVQPDFAQAHINAGNALSKLGRPTEAAAQWEAARRLSPERQESKAAGS
jgi:tetratricopeptide (TPR) repeat protein